MISTLTLAILAFACFLLMLAASPGRERSDAAGNGLQAAVAIAAGVASLALVALGGGLVWSGAAPWLALPCALAALACAFLPAVIRASTERGALRRINSQLELAMDGGDVRFGPTVVVLPDGAPMPDGISLAQACWRVMAPLTAEGLDATAEDLHALADAVREIANDPARVKHLGAATIAQWSDDMQARTGALHGVRRPVRIDAPTSDALRIVCSALEPANPRDDLHFSLDTLIDHLPADAVHAADRFRQHADALRWTLDAQWTWERVLGLGRHPLFEPLAVALPASLPAPPIPGRAVVGTGDAVAITGLWQAHGSGCPNLLIAGDTAPPQLRAWRRLDYPAMPAAEGIAVQPAWSHFVFESKTTRWRLVLEIDALKE